MKESEVDHELYLALRKGDRSPGIEVTHRLSERGCDDQDNESLNPAAGPKSQPYSNASDNEELHMTTTPRTVKEAIQRIRDSRQLGIKVSVPDPTYQHALSTLAGHSIPHRIEPLSRQVAMLR